MSVNADGTALCDNCGTTYPNGGIDTFLIVSDLVPSAPGMVETMIFCRPNNCNRLIRRAAVLKHYRKPKEADTIPTVDPTPTGDGSTP